MFVAGFDAAGVSNRCHLIDMKDKEYEQESLWSFTTPYLPWIFIGLKKLTSMTYSNDQMEQTSEDDTSSLHSFAIVFNIAWGDTILCQGLVLTRKCWSRCEHLVCLRKKVLIQTTGTLQYSLKHLIILYP